MELTFNQNASPEAIEAAKKLIERYNSITIGEIKSIMNRFELTSTYESEVPTLLTGYGNNATCKLCNAVKDECSKCIYADDNNEGIMCSDAENRETFEAISEASTPKQLVTAFRNRAAHITKIVELIEKHQANGTANS